MKTELYFPGPARDSYEAGLRAETAEFLARWAPGHVYVIEFSSGVVKVGKAKDPKARLAAHAHLARIHGGALRASWASRELIAYAGAEQELIRLCSKRGRLVAGREYFDIDFGTACLFGSIVEHNRFQMASLSADDQSFIRGEQVPA